MKRELSVFAGGALLVLLMSAGVGGIASKAGAGTESQTAVQNGPRAIPAPSQNLKIDTDYGKMPVYFIPNRGQMANQVAYYVQGKDKSLYFTPEGITIALTKAAASKGTKPELSKGSGPDRPKATAGERWVVKLDFVGAAKGVKPVGEDETGAVVSYFKGKQKGWKAGLPTYSKIAYRDLWPGIDLVYHGTVNRLKYEFVVYPGADPSQIRLAYRGADSLSVDKSGRLNVSTPLGGFQDDIPIAYQERAGKQTNVALAYELPQLGRARSPDSKFDDVTAGSAGQAIQDRSQNKKANRLGSLANSADVTGREAAKQDAAPQADVVPSTGSYHAYGFKVGDYDPAVPLILDPAFFISCGYIGGAGVNESGNGIAVDAQGNAYITGRTNSSEATFPVTVGPGLTFSNTPPYGTTDAFVAKINAAGTALLYCGYIGGSRWDEGSGIAVDAQGNAYVTGYTNSSEDTFPVTVGPDLTFNGTLHYHPGWGTYFYDSDAFVAKINPAGTALVYCGYIGGAEQDEGNGIAVDAAGHAYIAGGADSSEATFPVVAGPDLDLHGGAFVAKVAVSGAALDYCGYIGGLLATGIALDASGNAYVTGSISSSVATLPAVVGPDLTPNGNIDAFVTKINAAGTALVYCGYIGGAEDDWGSGIAVDASGSAYMVGTTTSSEGTFLVAVGPDLTYNGSNDAFVAKVNAAGSALVYCGYIGGSGLDDGWAIAVDGAGNAYVAGVTISTELTFPVKEGPDLTLCQHFEGGDLGDDGFVAKVNSAGSDLIYCGYVGGYNMDVCYGIAVDGSGNAFITGETGSDEATFPAAAGPDLTFNNIAGCGQDAFVAKVRYFDERIPKWAVGDVDYDRKDEVAVDFGSLGIWLYDQGNWTNLAPENPESLFGARITDSAVDILADLGPMGLWGWHNAHPGAPAGTWTQLSGSDVESMATGREYIGGGSNGRFVLFADFGGLGLWLLWIGSQYDPPLNWLQMSGANADHIVAASIQPPLHYWDSVFGDFGSLGMWQWFPFSYSGNQWNQLSGANAEYQTSGRWWVVADFGSLGLWKYLDPSGWSQLTGANPDFVIAADTNADGNDEIVGDFGSLGLWLWDTQWTQLTGANAVYMIRADVNGDGRDEIAVDFGSLGLWLWNNGTWSQLTGSIPEYLLAADTNGDGKKEILGDFGALGLWMWNEGVWSQISANNPD
jgi:hypothetical protein